MNGYIEDTYKTVETQHITHHGKRAILERRIATPDDHLVNRGTDTELHPAHRAKVIAQLQRFEHAREYLVLFVDGDPTYLFYTYGRLHAPDITAEEAAERLQHDWGWLTSLVEVDLKALRWCELVRNDVGQSGNGVTVMY